MSEYKNIRFDFKNQLAHIILNNPPSNLLTHSLLRELDELLEWLAGRTNLVAVILSASGGEFCGGLDFNESSREKVFSLTESYQNICRNLLYLECPTVALVGGTVKNWACDLLYFFDFVLCGNEVVFQYDNLEIGTFPPMGSLFLADNMGYKEALQLLFNGQEFSATRAKDLDLVSAVYSKDQLVPELKKLLTALTQKSLAVSRLMLRNLRRGKFDLVERYAEEIFSDYLNLLAELEDYDEGIAAWKERRKPVWKHQ